MLHYAFLPPSTLPCLRHMVHATMQCWVRCCSEPGSSAGPSACLLQCCGGSLSRYFCYWARSLLWLPLRQSTCASWYPAFSWVGERVRCLRDAWCRPSPLDWPALATQQERHCTQGEAPSVQDRLIVYSTRYAGCSVGCMANCIQWVCSSSSIHTVMQCTTRCLSAQATGPAVAATACSI